MIRGWNTPRDYDPADARRRQMIDETSAWLTWALQTGVELPRIPRNRVDHGGFSGVRRLPAAVIAGWWQRTLSAIATLTDRR